MHFRKTMLERNAQRYSWRWQILGDMPMHAELRMQVRRKRGKYTIVLLKQILSREIRIDLANYHYCIFNHCINQECATRNLFCEILQPTVEFTKFLIWYLLLTQRKSVNHPFRLLWVTKTSMIMVVVNRSILELWCLD